MGFAVFLEPHKELSSVIQTWKKRIDFVLPFQPYCSHPPHCTLIHVDVSNEKIAALKIKKALEDVFSFTIEIDQVGIFWQDMETGGGHTLYLRIKAKPEIFKLQLKIAKILSPIVNSKKIPNHIYNNSVLRESFKSYGFPYVGSHWIPHFTIASLKTEKSHPMITEFMKWQPSYTMIELNPSCWHIEGDKHIKLESN